MGKANKPKAVKLIIGMLSKSPKLFDKAEEFFVKDLGPIDYKSRVISFDYTDYYEKEMGSPLKRSFISFKKSISPEKIAKIKLLTNSIEEKFSVEQFLRPSSRSLFEIDTERPSSIRVMKGENLGPRMYKKRRINIDPGYISDSKLVLATTKDYFHRIYLNHGIYAEVTLMWRRNGFEPFEWTYPDYRSREYIDILNHIRGIQWKIKPNNIPR